MELGDNNYYDPGTGPFVLIDGMIVERDALHIAEKINEYDENLALMCIDPDKSELNDAPFLLIWKDPNGIWKRVFEFWKLDDTVLERIYNADQHRFDAFAKVLDLEAQVKKKKEDRYREIAEENNEKMLSTLVSKQSSYTVPNRKGDIVKHYENRPPEKNRGKKSFSSVGNPSKDK